MRDTITELESGDFKNYGSRQIELIKVYDQYFITNECLLQKALKSNGNNNNISTLIVVSMTYTTNIQCKKQALQHIDSP